MSSSVKRPTASLASSSGDDDTPPILRRAFSSKTNSSTKKTEGDYKVVEDTYKVTITNNHGTPQIGPQLPNVENAVFNNTTSALVHCNSSTIQLDREASLLLANEILQNLLQSSRSSEALSAALTSALSFRTTEEKDVEATEDNDVTTARTDSMVSGNQTVTTFQVTRRTKTPLGNTSRKSVIRWSAITVCLTLVFMPLVLCLMWFILYKAGAVRRFW